MDLPGPLRLFRAVLVTSLAVSLAVAGHVLAGGQLPDAVTLAVTAAFLLAPAAWLARRQLSFAVLFGVLGAGQLTLHAAFTAFSPGASCLPQLSACPVATCPAAVCPVIRRPDSGGRRVDALWSWGPELHGSNGNHAHGCGRQFTRHAGRPRPRHAGHRLAVADGRGRAVAAPGMAPPAGAAPPARRVHSRQPPSCGVANGRRRSPAPQPAA
jgi:hypothetical protein